MRRLTWCCVIGGLLGVGVGVGLSQDRSPFAPRVPSAFAPAPGSTSSGAMSRTQRKSYYAELFGSGGASPADPAATPSSIAESPPPQAEPAGVADHPTHDSAPRTPPRAGSFTLSGRPTAPTETAHDDVIHAAFERNPALGTEKDVIQVGGQRIVRPARRTSVERSPLTQPIAIPVQAEAESVQPLFDQAPEPPQDELEFDAPPVPAPRSTLNISRPRPTSGPGQYVEPIRATAGKHPARGTPTAAASAASVAAAAPVPATQAPNIRVAWDKQGEVSIGRECKCRLVLENTGAAAAQNLEVVAIVSDNVRLLRSDPAPARTDASLVWEIPELPAGGLQTIQITMLPLAPGEINTQAEVRYSTAVAGSFQIAEPKLALKLSGPPQTLLGESATQTILVTNPGTGVAANVQIAAVIPRGLEHARGGELLMEIGALHPGETRSVRLPLAAVSGGQHIVQVEARAEGGLVEQASCAVTVIAPQMKAAIEGPSLRYLGRRATYSIFVTNDGSVPSENVRVMHKVPQGFEFVSADHGGKFDSGTELLNWFVGRLEPGQTTVLAATFECKQIGAFTHFVRCTNDQGAVSDSQVSTAVEGTPRLSMSVRDLDDPVETGSETAYEIEIRNEGSAPAHRVQLTCELPESMTLINVSGPLAHRQAAGVIAFAALDQLPAGGTTKVRIHVRSEAAGNLRLRAQLASESLDEPLIEEELTKFYDE